LIGLEAQRVDLNLLWDHSDALSVDSDALRIHLDVLHTDLGALCDDLDDLRGDLDDLRTDLGLLPSGLSTLCMRLESLRKGLVVQRFDSGALWGDSEAPRIGLAARSGQTSRP
jgi:hypothetical protein